MVHSMFAWNYDELRPYLDLIAFSIVTMWICIGGILYWGEDDDDIKNDISVSTKNKSFNEEINSDDNFENDNNDWYEASKNNRLP